MFEILTSDNISFSSSEEYIKNDFFRIIHIQKGGFKAQISSNLVDGKPGTLVVIKPGTFYRFVLVSGKIRGTVIDFLPKQGIFPDSEVFTQKRYSDYLLRHMPTSFRFHSREDAARYVISLLKEEYEIDRHFFSIAPGEELIRAKEYIDKNYCKDISVTNIANHICLSESYFTHRFSSRFGIPPKQYILQKRILLAKEKLQHTTLSSKEIAAAVGFSAPQRFNDIFKKHTGTTPLEYRNKNKV